MFTQTVTIDQSGRIMLPEPILNALGVQPESELIIELTEHGVSIRTQPSATPITDRLATMNLPVGEWEQMEKEIEAGRLK